MRHRPLAEEVSPEGGRGDVLRAALNAEDASANAGLYVLFRALDRFRATHNRFPGTFEGYKTENFFMSPRFRITLKKNNQELTASAPRATASPAPSRGNSANIMLLFEEMGGSIFLGKIGSVLVKLSFEGYFLGIEILFLVGRLLASRALEDDVALLCR